MKDRAAIVGIGQTRSPSTSSRPSWQLACEAIVAALDDAGIAPVGGRRARVVHDGDQRRGPDRQERRLRRHHVLHPDRLRRRCRLRHGRASRDGDRDRAGRRRRGVAIAQARLGTAAVDQHDAAAARARAVDPTVGSAAPRRRDRACSPAATCTSTARPATTSPTSRWPAACTPTATRTRTMYERPMTREDYMAARWISEPLCLFDNCLETDGALACVVVSRGARQGPAPAAGLRPRVRAGPAGPAPDDDQLLQRGPAAQAPRGRAPSSCGATPTSGPADVDGRADLRRVHAR